MKTLVKSLAAFVVALVSLVAPASAQACTASAWNYTGNWAEQPQKNGMGAVLIHQGCVVFAQFFAYDNVRNPTWLSFGGPLKKDAQQRDFYEGALTLLHGSAPSGYDVLSLRLEDTGTVSITFTGRYSAVMTYRYPDPTTGTVHSGTLNLAPAQFGCEAPMMWDGKFCVAPMGKKVVGAKQLPAGCNTWKDQCWKDAVANGTVKLVETTAKMTGYSDRPIMIAYFKNTSSTFGTAGLWNTLELYADDGTPTGADIVGGSSVEIDWVVGSAKGVIFHDASRNVCGETYWDSSNKSWVGQPATCP